jgi:PEP-CTERM motif
MNMRASALLLAMVLLVSQASGDVIYRETFGRPADTGDLSVNLFDWADFNSTGAFNTDTPNSGINGSNDGRPIDVANVNAGTNSDGTTTALPRGIHYMLNGIGTPLLSMTPEYTVDVDQYESGSIVFSWYEGNADATATQQLAVEVGGSWYAHATPKLTPTTTLGQFTTNAVLQQVTYDPAAANWLQINFDGSYDTGTDMGTDSTTALSLGAAPGADLSGSITAFGMYVTGPGTRRFDTFQIDATPIGPACSIAGDFSCNGSVENADLTLLLNNWAATVPPTPNGWLGPAPTAPAVDNDELTALLNTWGQTSGGNNTVPEPASAALVLVGLALFGNFRRAHAR